MNPKCSAYNKRNEPCKNHAIKGSSFCYKHQNYNDIKVTERRNIRKYYLIILLVIFLLFIVVTILYITHRISGVSISQIGMGLEISGAIIAAPEILAIILGQKTMRDLDSRTENWAKLKESRQTQENEVKNMKIGSYYYWTYHDSIGQGIVNGMIIIYFLLTFPFFLIGVLFVWKLPTYVQIIFLIFAFPYFLFNVKNGVLDFIIAISNESSVLRKWAVDARVLIQVILFVLSSVGLLIGFLFALPFIILMSKAGYDAEEMLDKMIDDNKSIANKALKLYLVAVIFPGYALNTILKAVFIHIPVRIIRWVTYPIRYNLVQKSGILAGFLLTVFGNMLQLLSSI